jgi:hypothetical protein
MTLKLPRSSGGNVQLNNKEGTINETPEDKRKT